MTKAFTFEAVIIYTDKAGNVHEQDAVCVAETPDDAGRCLTETWSAICPQCARIDAVVILDAVPLDADDLAVIAAAIARGNSANARPAGATVH